MEQSRWKSPIFWGSFIVTVLGLVTSSGLITSDATLKVIGLVAGVVSAFVGAINNPTDGLNW